MTSTRTAIHARLFSWMAICLIGLVAIFGADRAAAQMLPGMGGSSLPGGSQDSGQSGEGGSSAPLRVCWKSCATIRPARR